ncbi:MAG: glycerophosphodiester phosphodiesterase, partial [Gemmatimonadota bacterium]|nr:glycerophosphodiester phosphodiesterase [Gemmatimonadota bacterium]
DGFGRRIAFNLEIKRPRAGPYPGLEAAVAGEVERRGLLAGTLFSCFYDPVLAALREASPGARIGLLVSRRYPARAVARAEALGAEALHPEAALVDRALVEEAHAAGLAVHPFTVDDEGAMGRLLDLGVDGLFTNVPARMRALVDARRQS